MKNQNKSLFDQILDRVPEEKKRFIQKKGDIAFQITAYLKKEELKQKEFAEQIGMKESRLSKILSGGENLTIKTITKLEAALGRDIIIVPAFVKPEIKIEQEVILIPIGIRCTFISDENMSQSYLIESPTRTADISYEYKKLG